MRLSDSKSYFDSIGSGWDELRQGFFPDSLREQALDVAGVSEGTVAADLGAGTGFITEALLKRGASVVAVDQSSVMLDELRRKFPWPERVDCRMGEAEALPIQDQAVDYAFANMYLHHVERPPVAIKEMVRILRPGGTLVITDLDSHSFEFLKQEHHDRWMGFERDRIRDWFEESGLTGVKVDCAGENCCASSADGRENADVSIFVASGVKPGE